MTAPTASISARAIASGVRGGKVRIVLALMPIKGGDVALELWPQGVEERLADGRGWALYAVPAVAGTGWTRPAPPASVAGLAHVPLSGATIHAYGVRRATAGTGRLVDQAVDLWKWVMGEGATGARGSAIWDGISALIDKAGGFEAPDPLQVAAVRRADAALYYSVARARSAFRRDRTAAPIASTLPPFDGQYGPKDADEAKADEAAKAAKAAADACAATVMAANQEGDADVKAALESSLALGRAQAVGRRRYVAAHPTVPQVPSALSDAATVGPALSTPAEVIRAALDGDHDHPLAREFRALHVAATLHDVEKNDAVGKTTRADGATLRDFGCDGEGAAQLLDSLERAPQLLFALRSNPTLGRLFRFVVDVEVPIGALVDATGGRPTGSGPAERFVFLAATFGDAAPVWVVTKLAFAGGELTQAWPALRAEVDLAAADAMAAAVPPAATPPPPTKADIDRARHLTVTQTGGLVRLGQGLDGSAPWSRHARYDLATIDPAFAAESDVRRSKLRQALVDNAARHGGGTDPAALAAVPDPSMIARGLVVLDRWRQSAVVGEIVNAAGFCQACAASQPVVVDAEDLATGTAIHMAAPVGATMAWRSQMHRRIAYADPRPSARVDIEAALAALGLGWGEPWRIQSDGASVTVPSRTRETAGAPVVHVEETLCAFEGDPLALSCNTEAAMAVTAGADLAISRAYSLATSGGDRPPPLRFGWRYKIGAGPIWAGGTSVPTETAAAMFDADPTLTLPSVSPALAKAAATKGFAAVRRFLRQDPIKAPVVLLPLHLAVREDDRVRQSGPVVILREGVEQDRSSWRVVVPPHVSLDDAWRHGVFDADPSPAGPAGAAPPRDGLAEVDWDEPWAGFPVYGRPGPADALTRAGLARLASNPAKRPGRKGALLPPPDDAGQPVFVARRPGGVRALPYYPDPAAEELVIALRPVAASETGEGDLVRSRTSRPYFDGIPLVVPLRDAGADFRDALPIALEFLRIDAHRDAAPTQESLFAILEGGRRHAERHADGTSARLDRTRRKGDARVIAVSIGLHMGEHLAADCWLAPTEAKLRGWFDLPETLALLGGADLGATDGKALAAVEDALGLDAGALGKAGGGSATKGNLTWLSSAGLPVREQVVASVARYLTAELRRKPIPQISGVLTIEAVHAVREPRQPQFVVRGAGQGGAALDLTRYDLDADKGGATRRELLRGYQKDGAWTGTVPPRATGVLLAGDVLVDRDASADLEVVALCASPQGAKMDDPDRKRTDQQRLEGVWPKTRRTDRGDPAAAERIERSDEVFGFSVGPDGTVELHRAEVTLLRIDGFRGRVDAPVSAGLDAMVLADEQVAALLRLGPGGMGDTVPVPDAPRLMAFDPFKDRLARRLRLGLRSSSRYLQVLDPIVPSPDTLLPPDPMAPPHRPPLLDAAAGPEVVWVEATQRPSAPAVHAALPLPVRTGSDAPDGTGCARWTRTCSVRVWLERPWFSSGEGERLGVIVWPPRTGKDAEVKLLQGFVERPRPMGGAPAEAGDQAYMAMQGFADEDLGPGGKFLTRWGADPIRAAAGPTGPFIPASALIDFDKGLQDALYDERLPADRRATLVAEMLDGLADPLGTRPGYVAGVPVPIFPDGSDSRDADPVSTILVDVVTYRPRFDPDAERWFVDVSIDPRAPEDLVEPFVRLGLVRFQAHALRKPDLRISAPATTWVQVLPPRDALVWREPADDDADAIVVQVTGPIAARIDPQGQPREPRLRVALMSETLLEGGVVATSVITQREEDCNGPGSEADGWVTVARGSPKGGTAASGGSWVRLLKDRDGPVDGRDGARRLSVLIEELEEYSSTDDEPAGDIPAVAMIGGPTTLAKTGERISGPRFSAKIAVPAAPRMGKPSMGALPPGAGRCAPSRDVRRPPPTGTDGSILRRKY